MAPLVHSPADLDGQEIVRWTGTEMALGGGISIVSEDTPEDRNWLETPVVWASDVIPFAQFTRIDVQLANGSAYRLLSQHKDGSGFHGLYLLRVAEIEVPEEPRPGCIYRSRELTELPVGQTRVSILRRAESNSIIEFELSIGTETIRMLSGEVYEREEGLFEVVESDESVLVQLNGERPNPSFNGTPGGAR